MGEAAWDETVDVLVIGSGAGAMTAALTAHDHGARTLLIEKSDRYGGSSAMSGGGFWIPNNHLMGPAGVPDTPEEAWTYLRELTRGSVGDDRIRAYLEKGPEMVRFLCERTRLRMVALPEYADYYPRVPGSKPGGRSIEPASWNASVLGDELLRMRDQSPQMLIMSRIFMTIPEARALLTRSPGWIALTLKLVSRYALDLPWRLKSRRDRNLAMGNALVGMLRASLLDREIPLWLETPARELLREGGRVVGVRAERCGRAVRIRALRGVVMAAGGFEADPALREQYLPAPTSAEWSCANPNNTGDALRMGEGIGAAKALMDEAWWTPTTLVPGEARARLLVIEKSLPGSILVNGSGERFVNEAAPYTDVVNAMYQKHGANSPCIPAYLIFDATFRKKYPCGPLLPGAQQPDWMLPKRLTQGYLRKADTISGLATQLGLDPARLVATVEKVNAYARTGKDLDFHRGETEYDRYYGDAEVRPNPCLAPLETPPFYALVAHPGELGTKGGLSTDAHARVLDGAGAPISGLYAIGNCSASVMGRTYPGAGATLGPACTFGYVAARHAMGAPASEPRGNP